MAVYNNMPFLPISVESILRQSFRDFELIIIDDGSTDGGGEWLEEVVRKDSRIRLKRRENRGLTKSLNEGCALARGEFIARMDGDDISYPKRFERQMGFLSSRPEVTVLGSYVRYINENGRPLFIRNFPTEHSQIVFCNLTNWGSFLMHPSVLMRKTAFINAGGYDESFLKSQDYDLWFRIQQHGELANLPEVLLDYRHHPEAISRKSAKGQSNFVRKILHREMANRGMEHANALPHEYQIQMNDPAWLASAAARSGFFRTYILEALRTSKRTFKTLFNLYGDAGRCLVQALKSTQKGNPILNKIKRFCSKCNQSCSLAVCTSIEDFANGNNLSTKILNAAPWQEIHDVFDDAELAVQKLGSHKETLTRRQVLVSLPRASICGSLGIVQLSTRQVLLEGNWWLSYLQAHADYKRRFYFKRQKIKGNVYSLLCMWAPNYYHWIIDVLPRLAAALPHLPSDTKFLLNTKPSEWQIESLAALSIGRECLVFQAEAIRSDVETLWFATPVCQTGYATRETLGAVISRLKNYFGADMAYPLKKIYISRRKASRRRLLNEDAVLEKLLPLGFEVLVCEEMAPAEQVKAFSQAHTIVAPHGAGLTNLIFAPEGCRIFEINLNDKINRGHYWFLSRLLGHSFECVDAEKANLSGNEFDLIADMKSLNRILASNLPANP